MAQCKLQLQLRRMLKDHEQPIPVLLKGSRSRQRADNALA